MGAELFRKHVISSIMICYRSVIKHPFLIGMSLLLILMYRLFPLLFSLLVSASPVIVSTALLLGTLLSFGQPNIPEIIETEIEKSKSDRDEVQKLESRVLGGHTEVVGRDVSLGFASVETNGSRIESFDDTSVGLVNDNEIVTEEKCENLQFLGEGLREGGEDEIGDREIDDLDEEKVVSGRDYAQSEDENVFSGRDYVPLKQSEDENVISGRDYVSLVQSEDENVGLGRDYASLKQSEDENVVLGRDYAPLKRSEDENVGLGMDYVPLMQSEDGNVGLGRDYASLKQSEDENVVLESDDKLWEGSADPLNSDSGLLWKRMEGDDSEEDDEGSDLGSDVAESSSPDASMADIIPMLDELHPLLAEESETREPTHMMPRDGTDASDSSSSSESNDDDDDGGIENHDDLEVGDDEDKESKHDDKEDEIKSVMTWTEDDQKNLMNLGTSELERNRRLENLIARRRARKTMRLQAEKNLIDLESADLPWNIPPISTARNNPFDYDSNDHVPGSAPSVMLKRRNPFDLPYDSSEEKPDLVGDTFQQEFAAVQPKEPFFRRHESFNVGPSMFRASRSERQETKLRPYFVPERIASDGSSFSSFQRQLSGVSDSKVTDTESVSSVSDLENKGHIEDELSLEKEDEHASDDVIQVTPYFVPEQVASAFQRQISELSESKVSSVPDTESVSSASDLENDPIEEDVSQEVELISLNEHECLVGIRENLELISTGEHVPMANEHVSDDVSQDDGNVESNQVEKEDDGLDEAETSVGNVTSLQELVSDLHETENAESSVEFVLDATHLNLGDRVLHSSASSLSSSSYEVSDQIYNEKDDDDEMPTSVAETDYYFVERGNSIDTSGIDITSLLVEESQPKEPVYDSSPRAVTKNLSSSSISTDLLADVSEKGAALPNSERPGSVSGTESQETVQKTVTDSPSDDAEFVGSSEQDAAEKIESRGITDSNLIELDLLHNDEGFQHAEDQHQASSSVADLEWNSTDSSPETRDAQSQMVPDNEEPLSAGDSISKSLSNEPLFETEDGLLDMDANEGVHQERVVSQPEESSLLNRSMEEPLMVVDPEELEGHEVERGHFVSSNSEAQSEEVVHEETYENVLPTHDRFESEEDILQPHNEFPLLDMSANEPSEENPEVLQVQVTSNDSDNLQIQEAENDISPSINHVLSPEPDVVDDVTGIETKAPETLAYTSDIHSMESENTPENIDDVDEIHEFDENLLVELDAVGDFSVNDLGSTSKEDQLASEHDLEIKRSFSNDLGSISNELQHDPRALEHDLEANPYADEDSHSNDLGSTLNELKQDPHGLEHDNETKSAGDEDSYSNELGSTLNEMKPDPHASEHDLEANASTGLESISNEMIQDPHDVESNRSEDEDSYIELKSSLNEMKQTEPRDLGAHTLETFYSVDETAFIRDIEFALNEMKQDPPTTDLSETKVKTGAEERTEPVDEKEIGNVEVAGASEMVNHGKENVLSSSNVDDKE